MTQVYPPRLPPTDKVTDGTALVSTTGTYATASGTPAYTPAVYTAKTTNHPAADPDFVLATAQTKACNMPY